MLAFEFTKIHGALGVFLAIQPHSLALGIRLSRNPHSTLKRELYVTHPIQPLQKAC